MQPRSTRSPPSLAGSVTAVKTHDDNSQHVDCFEVATIAHALPVSAANNPKISLFTAVRQNPRLSLLSLWLMLIFLLYGYEVVFLGSIASLPGFQ